MSFLMVRSTESEISIMDLDDLSVDSMPKSIFIQSKCFGIPCETRYAGILNRFKLSALRAGFLNYGYESVLKELCQIEGIEYMGISNEVSVMPLEKLTSVATEYTSMIKADFMGITSSTKLDTKEFDEVMDSLRNFSNEDLDYSDYETSEDDELDDDIFKADDDEYGIFSDDSEEFEDLQDYDDYDYDDDDGGLEYESDDDDKDMFSVAQLYGMLNEGQVKLLNSYYKWYSKMVFQGENGSLHLDTVESRAYDEWKKRELASIRGDEEWSYEGCVDTGKFPGGYCEFGHPLRYIHYARGTESGRVVSFGSKCVGDFFEVDATVMKAIRKAQSDSTSDLVNLCGIYKDKSQLESAWKSFEILNFVIDKFAESVSNNARIVKFALEFKKAHLLYPKTMVKMLKKYFLRTDTLKNITLNSKARSIILDKCFDNGKVVDQFLEGISYSWRTWEFRNYAYVNKSFDYSLCSLLDWVFNIKFDGIYQYNPVLGMNVRDEGGKSKQAIKFYENRECMAIRCPFYDDASPIEGLVNGFNVIGLMILTKEIKESFQSNWKTPYLNAYDAKYHNLDSVKKCITVSEELLSKMGSRTPMRVERWEQGLATFTENWYCMQGFKAGFSEVCKNVIIDKEPEESEADDLDALRRLSWHTDSFRDSARLLQSYIDTLEDSKLAITFRARNSFRLDVWDTVSRTERVSPRQAAVLSSLIEDVIVTMRKLRNGEEEEKPEGSLSNEDLRIVERALEILGKGDYLNKEYFKVVTNVIPTSALVKIKDVLKSVSTRRFASEKQMYYVNLAKELIKEVDKVE